MALKDNIARGTLLVFLRTMFPQGVDRQTICGIFVERIHPDLSIDSLEYMVSKGYIDRREIPHPYKKLEKIVTFRINSEGIDLCDGTTSDPGITIMPEED